MTARRLTVHTARQRCAEASEWYQHASGEAIARCHGSLAALVKARELVAAPDLDDPAWLRAWGAVAQAMSGRLESGECERAAWAQLQRTTREYNELVDPFERLPVDEEDTDDQPSG